MGFIPQLRKKYDLPKKKKVVKIYNVMRIYGVNTQKVNTNFGWKIGFWVKLNYVKKNWVTMYFRTWIMRWFLKRVVNFGGLINDLEGDITGKYFRGEFFYHRNQRMDLLALMHSTTFFYIFFWILGPWGL